MHGRPAIVAKIIGLGIGADQEREADLAEMRPDPRMPGRRTDRDRRLIAAVLVDARIAQPGGQDGDPRHVVESLAIELQPVPETISASVVPRYAGFMNARALRL